MIFLACKSQLSLYRKRSMEYKLIWYRRIQKPFESWPRSRKVLWNRNTITSNIYRWPDKSFDRILKRFTRHNVSIFVQRLLKIAKQLCPLHCCVRWWLLEETVKFVWQWIGMFSDALCIFNKNIANNNIYLFSEQRFQQVKLSLSWSLLSTALLYTANFLRNLEISIIYWY